MSPSPGAQDRGFLQSCVWGAHFPEHVGSWVDMCTCQSWMLPFRYLPPPPPSEAHAPGPGGSWRHHRDAFFGLRVRYCEISCFSRGDMLCWVREMWLKEHTNEADQMLLLVVTFLLNPENVLRWGLKINPKSHISFIWPLNHIQTPCNRV